MSSSVSVVASLVEDLAAEVEGDATFTLYVSRDKKPWQHTAIRLKVERHHVRDPHEWHTYEVNTKPLVGPSNTFLQQDDQAPDADDLEIVAATFRKPYHFLTQLKENLRLNHQYFVGGRILWLKNSGNCRDHALAALAQCEAQGIAINPEARQFLEKQQMQDVAIGIGVAVATAAVAGFVFVLRQLRKKTRSAKRESEDEEESVERKA